MSAPAELIYTQAAQRADFGEAVWVPAGLWPLIGAPPGPEPVACEELAVRSAGLASAQGCQLEPSVQREGAELEAPSVQGLSLEEPPPQRRSLEGTPLRVAVATGTVGSVVAGATAGALLAGPAAPLGAVVGGLIGSLVAVETKLVAAVLSGCPSDEQRPAQTIIDGLVPQGEGSAAAIAECKLELVQQRTGLCVEEARYYIDEAQGDAEEAVATYEAEEAALQEALLANPSLRLG